jgi:catechol 2,3-dioxygenase-like lactoylglutathione lyase family enzyme
MSYRFEGLDHVQLAAPAGCEAQARAFFGALFGWEEIDKPEPLRSRGGVWFRCGAHQVHIGVQADFVAATKAHPAFAVTNLEALRSHLAANAVAVTDDDARSQEAIVRFYVSDPFGNRLEFMERVPGSTAAP